MRFGAVILAAGSGTRFGSNKVLANLGGKPVWRWSFDQFLKHPSIDEVGIVCSKEDLDYFRSAAPQASFVSVGGDSRQESSLLGVQSLRSEAALVHDAARPFVTNEIIGRVIEAVRDRGAAAPGVPLVDSVVRNGKPIDRSSLQALQTPQGAIRADLLRAHSEANQEGTDEISMLAQIGVSGIIVPGDPRNFKITHFDDLSRAEAMLGPIETRTGLGYDIHAFCKPHQPGTMLGGVHFPEAPKLEGHSDADVLLHAITDALLGAAAMGDIGVHFPNSDPQWKGKASIHFLSHACGLLMAENWRILNIDATVIAEAPKVMSRSSEIRAVIAQATGLGEEQVSVKATTNERLGSIGRSEGIAAFAIATIQRRQVLLAN